MFFGFFSLISNTYYFNINIHILIIITFLTSPLMASLLVEDNSLPDFTESRLDSASWLISSDRSTDMELLRTSSVSERLWWRVWLDSDLDALPMLDLCSYQGKAGKLQKIRRKIKIHIWFSVNCVELITSSNFEQAPFTDFHILLLFLLTVLNYLYGI